MILDRIEYARRYFPPESPYAKAISFARDKAAALADGVHRIDGDRLKANVESYETLPVEEKRFESHQLYGDVQIVLEGAERQDFSDAVNTVSDGGYQEEQDVAFYQEPTDYSTLRLHPGSFVVYQPGELHRPGVALAQGVCAVRKVCMKVRIQSQGD